MAMHIPARTPGLLDQAGVSPLISSPSSICENVRPRWKIRVVASNAPSSEIAQRSWADVDAFGKLLASGTEPLYIGRALSSSPAIPVYPMLRSIKARIKRAVKSSRIRYARAFHPFSAADLEPRLRALGIASGDTLLVHSAFDAFEGFVGKPTDVLAALQRIVTETGALMLPTLPFTGTAVAYAEGDPVFEPLRTPSRMGLLTELFRRMPDVVRSIHPTHSVAIWGRDAEAIAADHWQSRTPCGVGSPYFKLLGRNGKILLLGTDISSLTFYHTVEELLESSFPASPFASRIFRLRSRLQDGSIVETVTRLFEPAVSKRRNLYKLVPELKRRNAWHSTRIGRLTVVLLAATDVLECVRAMASQEVYCYDAVPS